MTALSLPRFGFTRLNMVNQETKKRLYQCTFGDGGLMLGWAHKYPNAKIAYASTNKWIIGWSIAFQPQPNSLFTTGTFVIPGRRRQGVGKRLLAILAEEVDPSKIRVLPWNTPSMEFFRRTKQFGADLMISTEYM